MASTAEFISDVCFKSPQFFLDFFLTSTSIAIYEDTKRGAAYVDERRTDEEQTQGIGSKSFMARTPKKKNQKPKLNITLHQDTKQKLAALAELEKRSVSNLIEVMADRRWEELAEQEGVDWAKIVAEIAGLKGLSADKEADRKVFRREILKRVLKFKNR